MSPLPEETPAQRIEKVLAEIADHIHGSPVLQARLLELLQVPVEFRGSEAVQAIDPVVLAAQGWDTFRETLMTFTPAELKRIIKVYDLAGGGAVPKQKAAMVQFMWDATEEQIHNYTPRTKAVRR